MSENSQVSTADYQRALRQLNLTNENRRNLDRQLRVAGEKNQKLVRALEMTKAEIERMRVAMAQQVSPPLNSAVVLEVGRGMMTYSQLASGKTPAEVEPYLDVLMGGRLVRLPLSPLLNPDEVEPGMTVLLNEHSQAVVSLGYENYGDVVVVREVLDASHVVVELPNQAKTVARLAGSVSGSELSTGDAVIFDSKVSMVRAVVPSTDAQELILEEVPDITYSQIGGLSSQIEQIQDAVELPFLHPEVYREYHLTPPKGILLYGPPGNGKTLIAKAVANSLAHRAAELSKDGSTTGYFLNIKGPELLDKFVGETERQIRDIFRAAREKAAEGNPVVVFFDEMESLFRTRGSGRSSDVETTIVPQLLAEIDGVERLDNVIVIGATNREDMIDPAVLRPGRLDVKIRINRPDAAGAREIFGLYLNSELPVHESEVERAGSAQVALESIIDRAVNSLYSFDEFNRYISVEFENGISRWLYRGDFLSGAVIRNIVDNAKKQAIKDFLATGSRGLRAEHVLEAIRAEFEDQVDVPQAAEIEDVLAQKNLRLRFLSASPVRSGRGE
ncbi:MULTISPECIES: proteasome ATPase [unclassified Rothia (in: high G+C Gram-positive bacteria)]|uniref:proteasome ATPase n=1 Tax=unclassified Rothia (in: high G+C Gram-positive bacteria) TaxID=2689056 RepID=UPI00195CF6B7|nr:MULTISPECIES: proteasome ATPase [unclassified Rothia (in: high G+C Gram-positive bacteria)]MBM7050562.1 proteasome ATPase [Rothia sp. ZJ1223]QRZ60753.1 proteasome ATPase [Rothia sp. ZJ932]